MTRMVVFEVVRWVAILLAAGAVVSTLRGALAVAAVRKSYEVRTGRLPSAWSVWFVSEAGEFRDEEELQVGVIRKSACRTGVLTIAAMVMLSFARCA